MMNGVSFRGTENIQQPQENQAPQTKKSTAKKAVAIAGTVLAGAAACAGIIYAVKTGKKVKGLQQQNQTLAKEIKLAKCWAKNPTLANNIQKSANIRAARAAAVNTPNITSATRGVFDKEIYIEAKNSQKLTKLIAHIKEANAAGNTKALNGMLQQYDNLTGMPHTLEQMLKAVQ